jgi:anti-sigma B factor antagonist
MGTLPSVREVLPEVLPSIREGPLRVGIDRDGDSLVVRAVGEIDFASVKMLRESLLDALESDASSMTLDLTEVGFIDSSGIQVLVWAAGRSGENGDRLRIRCGSGPVRRVIEVCGLESVLPLSA